jgi:alkanesulfonate monooxygenase SsuD/methylene tetrahydromethanopterin reductase-like flavin-dependent oxidoreductase (luciferase family)
MRVGLALPQYEVDRDPAAGSTLEAATGIARRAEALGLDSVWVSDHPFAVAPDGTVSGALEPLVLLAALGRETSRIELGTLVLAATMRSPGLVAHSARGLAPGRLVVGVGTGWYEPEHRAYGIALPGYGERITRVEATIDALHGLASDRPSILLGGTGRRLIELAARRADVWNVSWDAPPEGFALLSRRVDEACERAGGEPSSIRRSVGLTVLVGARDRDIDAAVERLRGRAAFLSGIDRDSLGARIVTGTPEACAERIASYRADEVVIALGLRDDPEMLDLFATEVAPLVRRSSR